MKFCTRGKCKCETFTRKMQNIFALYINKSKGCCECLYFNTNNDCLYSHMFPIFADKTECNVLFNLPCFLSSPKLMALSLRSCSAITHALRFQSSGQWLCSSGGVLLQLATHAAPLFLRTPLSKAMDTFPVAGSSSFIVIAFFATKLKCLNKYCKNVGLLPRWENQLW